MPLANRIRRGPPANPSGDQLIRDYLTRVTHAGLRLPKGHRVAFVGRTKARIERELGPDGTDDPGKVLHVLDLLGAPEDLVRAERAKIEEAWAKRRAASRRAAEAAEAAAGAAPGAAPGAASPQTRYPTPRQPLPSDTQPLPHLPTRPSADPPTDPGSTPLVPGASGTPADPGVPGTPAARRVPEAAGTPPELPVAAVARLARRNVLETIALVLLAVGGVIFPIVPPAWVAGSLLALLSGVWDLRDKAVALFGPGLITAVIAAMIAVVNRVPGNFVVIYVHAFADGAGYLLRFGCVASAVYLAWRVYRGPRVKVPPWRREAPQRRSPWFRSR